MNDDGFAMALADVMADDPAASFEIIRAQRKTILELVAALRDAREDVNHWASYASDYFQNKWGLSDDLARIDAVLSRFPSPPTTSKEIK